MDVEALCLARRGRGYVSLCVFALLVWHYAMLARSSARRRPRLGHACDDESE